MDNTLKYVAPSFSLRYIRYLANEYPVDFTTALFFLFVFILFAGAAYYDWRKKNPKKPKKRKQKKVPIYTIEQIDAMSGRIFEFTCANILKAIGYTNVKVTPASGDYGADVICRDGSDKYAVQCKRYKSTISNSAVQEVVAAKSHYSCNKAMIITNSTLTKNAMQLAKSNGVVVIDRSGLKRWLDRFMVINYNEGKEKIQRSERASLVADLMHQEQYDGEWYMELKGMPIAVGHSCCYVKDIIWNSPEESEDDIDIKQISWEETKDKKWYRVILWTDHIDVFKKYESKIKEEIWNGLCRKTYCEYGKGDDGKDYFLLYINKEMSV